MSSRPVDPHHDPVGPEPAEVVSINLDGHIYRGVRGQSVAGILLANGVPSWRTTSAGHEPRGVFCGIGICFDCLVNVDGRRDVRACLYRPHGGEGVHRQYDLLPTDSQDGEDA